jgi:hypothetical protein
MVGDHLLVYIDMDGDGVRVAAADGFEDIFTREEARRMVEGGGAKVASYPSFPTRREPARLRHPQGRRQCPV